LTLSGSSGWAANIKLLAKVSLFEVCDGHLPDIDQPIKRYFFTKQQGIRKINVRFCDIFVILREIFTHVNSAIGKKPVLLW
jgi:hypothetical protein